MDFKLIGTTTDEVRINWVIKQLKALPDGIRILDAGAGELRFKPHCSHLQYVAQDFSQYDGGGGRSWFANRQVGQHPARYCVGHHAYSGG